MIMRTIIINNIWSIPMYVCVCNAVTDKQIRQACENGACTMEDLSRELNVATCCGRCQDCARKILCENTEQTFLAAPLDMAVPA